MESKEDIIINLLKDENYVPMKAKEIAVILNVPKNEYQDFRKILDNLVSDCKIEVNRKSRYKLVDSTKFISGVYSANSKGFGFVKIDDGEEIYISGKYSKKALNGDKVLVEIIANSTNESHKEGKVIKILKHEKDTVVGLFKKSRNFAFVIPDDKNFGTDIYISKKNFASAKENDKVLVKITKFPTVEKNAEGKVIEILGNIDEAGVDILSLVKEYKLPYDFPEQVLKEARSINQNIQEKDRKYRVDLQDKEIFTIDGEDAKDLDDAVCVGKLENGNYSLGVHIADVSNYVKEGTNLDNEAILRGTSIYMMDRVIPMLPKELSNGICSLNAGFPRLAISVFMEIDKNGKVVSSDIKKSIIKVTKRMNYSDVTKLLEYNDGLLENITEKDKKMIEEHKNYISHFVQMRDLAEILKKKRKKDGSLDLDVPESKIILNENGIAIDVKKYELSISNEIIEQFMLIANETVAEKFYWLEAPFIYRVHEVPDIDKIKELNKFLGNLGYRIKGNKDNIHPKAFAEVLEQVKGKPEEIVVSNLVLRTLKVARYEPENRGHFGIASKCYCHFTSPIRRYPDLFIHRVISKYIEKNYNLSDEEKEKYNIQSIKYADSSSEREKIAQKVERDSSDIKMAEFMHDKIGEIYDGIISNITSFGVFVQLDNTVEGLIRFENLGNEYYIYDEDHKYLIGDHTGETLKIGDKMKIRVIEANKLLRRISFERYLD